MINKISPGKIILSAVLLSALSFAPAIFLRYKVKHDLEMAVLTSRDELVERVRDFARSPLTVRSLAGLNPEVINRYNPELKACLLGRCLPAGIGKPQPLALQNRVGTIVMSGSAVKPGTGSATDGGEVSSAPLGEWLYLMTSGVPCGLPAGLGKFPKCPLMLQTYFTYDCENGDCSKPEKVQIKIHFYIRFNKEAPEIVLGIWPNIPFPPIGTYPVALDESTANAEPVLINAGDAFRGYFETSN